MPLNHFRPFYPPALRKNADASLSKSEEFEADETLERNLEERVRDAAVTVARFDIVTLFADAQTAIDHASL